MEQQRQKDPKSRDKGQILSTAAMMKIRKKERMAS